jgi:capsular exopolysaccharide synthesis family protein
MKQMDKTALLEHITYDYQTIRTNLRFLNDGIMPKIIVVTSPVMAEGKTTLSINLASSLAKAGNKVLLIDGDLWKPDIARLVNLPGNSSGLRDVLLGLRRLEEAVHTSHLIGLDILATGRRNDTEVIEQLSKPEALNIIEQISSKYDNVIIDTSPVLATHGALLWAKMADAVVLSSFAGYSAGPDLKEALERLAQVNVRVLGNVLCNVSSRHSYNRYGYDYGSSSEMKNKDKVAGSRALMLSLQPQNSENDEPAS